MSYPFWEYLRIDIITPEARSCCIKLRSHNPEHSALGGDNCCTHLEEAWNCGHINLIFNNCILFSWNDKYISPLDMQWLPWRTEYESLHVCMHAWNEWPLHLSNITSSMDWFFKLDGIKYLWREKILIEIYKWSSKLSKYSYSMPTYFQQQFLWCLDHLDIFCFSLTWIFIGFSASSHKEMSCHWI